MVLRQPKADFIHKRYTAIDTSLYSGILQLNTWTETPKFTGQTALYLRNRLLRQALFYYPCGFHVQCLAQKTWTPPNFYNGKDVPSVPAKPWQHSFFRTGRKAYSNRHFLALKATHVKIGIETFSRISNDRLVVGYVTPVSPLWRYLPQRGHL